VILALFFIKPPLSVCFQYEMCRKAGSNLKKSAYNVENIWEDAGMFLLIVVMFILLIIVGGIFSR